MMHQVWREALFFTTVALMLHGCQASCGNNCPVLELCKVPEQVSDVPQMVLFTYSGQINMEVRGKLSQIFSEKIKNPDQCPIKITLFSVTEDTDPCSLHKMYFRGHEIALSGLRRTSRVNNWNLQRWNDSIARQQELVSNISHIKMADIRGMRAQNFFPGNNSQFEMLNLNSFAYDSSLLVEQKDDTNSPAAYFWPFLLNNETLEELKCRDKCPNETFEGLWEVPGSKLYIDKSDTTGCPYLDMCLEKDPNANEVFNILKYNYEASKNCSNAPLQINIRKQILDSPEAMKGLTEFVKYCNEKKDTWIITLQNLVEWMNVPTENMLLKKGFWDCSPRTYTLCLEAIKNSTFKQVTFESIIDVNHIWIWQTVLLIVLYVIVYRYDKHLDNKNK